MKFIFHLIFTMTLMNTGPDKGSAYFTVPERLPAENYRDVAYGPDSLQKMDIFLPESRTASTTNVLVVIHGGGWNSGSKNDFIPYIDSFRKRMPGYAVFNLNYRLYNGRNHFPAQEDDIRLALNYIRSKASVYHINLDKMVLLGASAGAHLALLQAYKYQDPSVAAVIDFFGPSDLVTMYDQPWHPFVPHALEMVTGYSLSANRTLYKTSSPVNFITSTSAPTLVFHGANDPIVDVSQSKILTEKLEKAGVVHELIIYPGQRHGWYGSTLSNSFDRIESFLKVNVK